MCAAPASADLPMIVPSLEPPPPLPSWAVCRECGDSAEPAPRRPIVEGFWECPGCRNVQHQSQLERAERRACTDLEIRECYREDLQRGERGGGGSRSKRYGQKKVDPIAPRPEQEASGGRGDYEAPKTRSVKVPEDAAEQVAELARAIKVPASRLWGVALQRGLEVLRAAKFCLACGGSVEGPCEMAVRGCNCEQ